MGSKNDSVVYSWNRKPTLSRVFTACDVTPDIEVWVRKSRIRSKVSLMQLDLVEFLSSPVA